MALAPCASCAEMVPDGTCVCPHCGGKACRARRVSGAAVLLGLTLAACGGKGDSGETTTSTGTTGTVQPPYGVATTDSGLASTSEKEEEEEETE